MDDEIESPRQEAQSEAENYLKLQGEVLTLAVIEKESPRILPERRIWGAVLRASIVDIMSSNINTKKAALSWLFLEPDCGTGSVDWILDVCFDLDPYKFRAKLYETYLNPETREILQYLTSKQITSHSAW